MRTRVYLLLSLLALLVVQPAGAQSTTGQIRGRVVDDQDRPVANTVVTVTGEETGLTRTSLTDRNGVYTVRLLPPGTYRVSTQVLGFRGDEQGDVQVMIGQAATVNFSLTPQAVAIEGVNVVAGAERIDVTGAGVTNLVSREEIEELPALGRDFTDFINLSGLVAPDPGATTGGQFSIAGQRASQTNLQIDGVDANNAFFGENRGGSRIPFVFSLESIEEFQVITNGYDVEYGNYSGGIVNVVTRGGTNEVSGNLYTNYRSDALTSSGFLEGQEVKEFSAMQYAGRISGPIVEDKAFYSFSFDGQRRREPQVPLTLDQYLPGGAREDAAAAEEVQRFFGILRDVYGIEDAASGYQSFQTTNDVLSVFGRLDWVINDAHRLSVRHNYANYKNDREFDERYDSYYGVSRAENLSDLSNSFVTELQSVLGANTFNVLRFQFATEERPRMASELRPALITRLSNGDLIGYGGTFVAYHNNLDERKLQFIDNLTHVVGDHTLKVGADALFTRNENWFLPPFSAPCGRGSQGAGVFCFDDLDALAAGNPSAYVFNVWQGGQVPYSDVRVSEVGLYMQDEWRVTPELTVTAGLRHDRQNFSRDPGRVIDVERAFGYETGTAPEDVDNISPRLSIAYNPDGAGRSVLRAGAGYFFGRVPHVLAGNVAGSQTPVYYLSCTGSVEEGATNAPPDPRQYDQWAVSGLENPTSCRGSASLSGVPTYTVWNPDFEYPETFKANVGYETLLGTGTRISADVIFSQGTNLYTVRNLNLRPHEFALEGEGGRRIFTPAALFDPSGGNTEEARLYSDFGDVYVNYNDGRSRALVGTLELSHRLTESTSVRGSYTYTRSYDNSSYSCCTANAGYTDPTVGAYGPNEIGGIGDEDHAWGPSDFERRHTFVLSGNAALPLGIQASAIWRLQSGRPYTPEVGGDLNGDGVNYNDRPFIFAPEDLPLASTGADAEAARGEYAALLSENACIGDHVGGIIPRNTCRTPWTNLLDMRISKGFPTTSGQRAELQIDLFNVLNGVGRLFCSAEDRAEDPSGGACGWGRVTTVSGSSRNLFVPEGFDDGRILYGVSNNFGRESVLGSDLLLQFQAQVGFRYFF